MDVSKEDWLSKEEVMKKYNYTDRVFASRMKEMRDEEKFREGYISPVRGEIYVVESLYKDFLAWRSKNKFKSRKSKERKTDEEKYERS